jgi:hypothetical protein
VTALRLRCNRTSQCLWEISANTGVGEAAYWRPQATSAPSAAPSPVTFARVPRSLLTLDLSSAAWSAKINFVEGGSVVGTSFRVGRQQPCDEGTPQPSIKRVSPFIVGGSHPSTTAGSHPPRHGFYLFCSQKRFLLDFSEISAVACSTTFIEVPVQRYCRRDVASRGSRARGAARDRESGCGQQQLPSKQWRHRRLCEAMP